MNQQAKIKDLINMLFLYLHVQNTKFLEGVNNSLHRRRLLVTVPIEKEVRMHCNNLPQGGIKFINIVCLSVCLLED